MVCSNGLIIGVTHSDVRRRHIGDLGVARVGAVLTSGLRESKTEKKNFESWRRAEITLNRIVPWVDTDLRKEWGFKAAARTFHIARFGYDADVAGQYTGAPRPLLPCRRQSAFPVRRMSATPFHLSQILAWLSKERRDVEEQLEWRKNT